MGFGRSGPCSTPGRQVATVVQAQPDEVLFTSGATESNNLAIFGLEDEGRRSGRLHVITTQIEHKAVLEPLEILEERGFEVVRLPCDPSGWVHPEAVAEALRDDTSARLHDACEQRERGHPAGGRGGRRSCGSPGVLPRGRRPGLREGAGGTSGVSDRSDQRERPQGLWAEGGGGFGGPEAALSAAAAEAAVLRWGAGARATAGHASGAPDRRAGAGWRSWARRRLRARKVACLGRSGRKLLAGLAPLAPVIHGDPERTVAHTVNLSFPGTGWGGSDRRRQGSRSRSRTARRARRRATRRAMC